MVGLVNKPEQPCAGCGKPIKPGEPAQASWRRGFGWHRQCLPVPINVNSFVGEV